MKTFKEFVQLKEAINMKDPKTMQLLAAKITDPKKKQMLQKAMATATTSGINPSDAVGIEDLANQVNSSGS